jgi:hypothetical protein
LSVRPVAAGRRLRSLGGLGLSRPPSVERRLSDALDLERPSDGETMVARDQPTRLLPGREEAARRVEGRSANVGDVLAPERECDRRPVFRFAPGLPREPQDRMGDALLDALGRPCRDGPTQGPLLALLKGRI